MKSYESIQFYSTIHWTLCYLAIGLKEGGSVDSATKKVIACLLPYCSPLLRVMEAIRNAEDFPSISESWFLLPQHEVCAGDGERPSRW